MLKTLQHSNIRVAYKISFSYETGKKMEDTYRKCCNSSWHFDHTIKDDCMCVCACIYIYIYEVKTVQYTQTTEVRQYWRFGCRNLGLPFSAGSFQFTHTDYHKHLGHYWLKVIMELEVWVMVKLTEKWMNIFFFNFIITPTIIEQYNVSKVKALSAEKLWYAYIYRHRFYIKTKNLNRTIAISCVL
jgi:hypothetical protein